MGNSFNELEKRIMQNQVARTAAIENGLRRQFGKKFEAQRTRLGLSIKKLAEKAGISLSQTQRALHRELGGTLQLKSIVRVADVLGFNLTISVE